ncbi:MAG TPA: dienelactone hydrolase family protein [Polyangiales bacterium]|nr:dienelactone hydrolase family protein [Polyangiales bacterium]
MGARTGEIGTYQHARFEHAGAAHDVYRKGSGPAVIVLAELPGISPQLLGFADRVVERGFSVAVPHLFGPALTDVTKLSSARRSLALLRTTAEVCISREFNVFASGRASPVTNWLRGLVAVEHDRCGGPGVGVVGMCFTGGFALALAADPRVLAPVVSHPSLPFGTPRGIDCDKLTLAAVAQRCAKEELEVLGLRFKRDPVSPYPRFQYLRQKLGDGFVAVEIDPKLGNPRGPYSARHSVLTVDALHEPGNPTLAALERVLDLFERKLLTH